jgi:hypothetical protein
VQGDKLIVLGIAAMVLAPLLFFGGLAGGLAVVVKAPDLARRRGMEAPDWAVRAVAVIGLLAVLTLVWPEMAQFVVLLSANLLIPAAIVVLLFVALAVAAVRRREGFGAVFWRIAAPVPLLCAFFVLLMIPATWWKLRELETHGPAATGR